MSAPKRRRLRPRVGDRVAVQVTEGRRVTGTIREVQPDGSFTITAVDPLPAAYLPDGPKDEPR